MANQKDIFQMFRDQRDRLDEVPHPRAWRRLEQRLDAQRQRRRLPHYRLLGLAAGVLFLLALLGVLALFTKGPLDGAGISTPLVLEELRQSDVNPLDLQAIKIAQAAQQQLRHPVAEGQAGQRLVPRQLTN